MTNKEEYNKRHGYTKAASHSKSDLSKISKVPIGRLQKVYDRGVGAHKTNPTSVRMKGTYTKNIKAPISNKLSKEQWGMARVYSFLNKSEGKKKLNHDLDLSYK